jgi:hypothetical protein
LNDRRQAGNDGKIRYKKSTEVHSFEMMKHGCLICSQPASAIRFILRLCAKNLTQMDTDEVHASLWKRRIGDCRSQLHRRQNNAGRITGGCRYMFTCRQTKAGTGSIDTIRDWTRFVARIIGSVAGIAF